MDLFDPALLETARIPTDFPLDTGRVVFLWQRPSASTLAWLQRCHPGVPILVGRFDAETPVHDAGIAYWAVTDFFPWRAMVDFEMAGLDAQMRGAGLAQPTYHGMPLVDGDHHRCGVWSELVACAATWLVIRRVAPDLEVLSDWMGRQLVAGAGLKVRRLWRADLADANWPIRRWVREHARPTRGRRGAFSGNGTTSALAGKDDPLSADIVILLGGWVEPRLLEVFPIEALVEAGHRCVLWVHRRSPALEALIARTGVRCEQMDYPPAAANTGPIKQEVARWCGRATEAGYFAPLRGPLAHRLVQLMGWPRWAPKLIAMHRLLTRRLARESPRLFIAPAEKDWSAYCGHHAARRLGIPTVGIKHGIWLPGSYLERYDHRVYFPPAPDYMAAYTPQDADLCHGLVPAQPTAISWQGNPRLEKVRDGGRPAENHAPARIVIATSGIGPGLGAGFRKRVVPANVRLVEALSDRLGSGVKVRLHPWDSPAHYPRHLQPLFLPPDDPLERQLAESAAVATTYSLVALDASAAGRPVFAWDYEQLDLDRSEIAREGGLVARADLDELVEAAARFVDDPGYRRTLSARAARFPEYLRRAGPEPMASMRSPLSQWLSALAGDASHHAVRNGSTRRVVLQS